ncbi:hypothetical protein GF402_10290 [Candidatus Fermentibacteria bacterium]|nr:hypothetical protein [Candidatus Fermentibacteria bacterium]
MRTPSHAVLSTTVPLMRRAGPRGFVNAVLRRMTGWSEEGLPLHVRWSHPRDLVQRWIDRYGKNRTEDLLAWDNSVPDIGGYVAGSESGEGGPGRFMGCYRYLNRRGALDMSDPGLSKAYVQDEASAVAGRGAALLPGGRVLEVGAAPGGKTAHLQRWSPTLVCMDVSFDRMGPWRDNAGRLGWRGCVPVVGEGESPPFGRPFDKVVLDVPCTATGVYRRRPRARWRWNPGALESMTALQRDLLRGAVDLVKIGGYMVYITCSLEPEENLEQVEWFERSFPRFSRAAFPAPGQLVEDGLLDIFPPEHGIDGLFAACWVRNE